MEIHGFRGEIRLNEPLSRHTSYGIGGPADVFALPRDRDDLRLLLREVRQKGLPALVLGGGTNLLVRDGGFRGIVISLQHLNAIRTDREYRSIGGSFIVILAEAGAHLSKTLAFAVQRGLTGLEFAAGIPGTVGGAVCMNAGTSLGEMGDIIESVTLLSPDSETIMKTREEMAFSYRTSLIPDRHVVLDARLVLRRGEREEIQARIKELISTRKQRQPWGTANAGSVFKNPQEEAAGTLIESAGLKGRTIGAAQVSEKHANFIVNLGSAKAADVLRLMDLVRERVLEVHRVKLEPEIKVIGED